MAAVLVYALPGIAEMEELAVHTPPGIADMQEFALHALPGPAYIPELAVHTVPGTVATAPPVPYPASDAIEPAPRDLGIIIVWIAHETGGERLALPHQPTVDGMQISLVRLAITPRRHPVRVRTQCAKYVGNKGITIIHCLDVWGVWPIEEDGQAPGKGFKRSSQRCPALARSVRR
jgi:hypothetical protein